MMLMLAQMPRELTPQDRSQMLISLAILMLIVIIGGVGIMLLRRKLRDDGNSSEADTGFSLSSLREMRDKGEITAEEYEKARAKIVAKVKGTLLPPEEGDLGAKR